MITGDQLAIGKETGRRLGMGTNMYPSSSLIGENKDGVGALPIDELIENAGGFATCSLTWEFSYTFILSLLQ